MIFHRRLSRTIRLLLATVLVSMLWMVAMVVYFDQLVSHGDFVETGPSMRGNKLRGILEHSQENDVANPDFVRNVIVIANEDSAEKMKSTQKFAGEFEIDNSGPFYIEDTKRHDDLGSRDQVADRGRFGTSRDADQGQNSRSFDSPLLNFQSVFRTSVRGISGSRNDPSNNPVLPPISRTTKLGPRGQILPSIPRHKLPVLQRTTRLNDKQNLVKSTAKNPTFVGLGLDKVPYLDCDITSGCILRADRSFSMDERNDLDHGMKRHAFNVQASEKKALDRWIPDTRPSSCLSKSYTHPDYPPVSVVICFHNEALSTLLRTLTSLLLRTPSHLLHEVVLVDDASQYDYLGEQLEAFVNATTKVKLLRLKKREGLIRARIIGANYSSGDVLVFLDSHCECNNGWLEPLLEQLKHDRKKIVCPDVDVIKPETFDYVRAPRHVYGSFDWNLNFEWQNLPNSVTYQRQTEAEPIATPVMIGGLFAVDRRYFFEIGAYDPEMGIWGAENLEISFRVWMCGGRVEIIPCSRVGHVFRRTIPYKFPDGTFQTIRRNLVRVAEIWMDRYKMYYYASRVDPPDLDPGPLESRKRLRERLKCHDFDWYLRTIAVTVDIPPIYAQYYGEVKSKHSSTCLDSLDADEGAQPFLMPCHGQHGNQLFYITINGDFIHRDVCLSVSNTGQTVVFSACDTTQTKWVVSHSGQIQVLGLEKCLAVINLAVEVTSCQDGRHNQQWKFSYHFDYGYMKT